MTIHAGRATAAACGADLIVIGQPRTTSRRIVMASTAGALLRRVQARSSLFPGPYQRRHDFQIDSLPANM